MFTVFGHSIKFESTWKTEEMTEKNLDRWNKRRSEGMRSPRRSV